MIEVGYKLLQIRLYGEHEDNYVGSVFVFKDGTHGVLAGLTGINFYDHLGELFDVLHRYDIDIVHGNVTKAHARLIRMRSKGYEVTFEPTTCEGREMVWITARRL